MENQPIHPIDTRSINESDCQRYTENNDKIDFISPASDSDNDDQDGATSYQSDNDNDDFNGDQSLRQQNKISYIGKKPKWWKTLARRKGTKGQRRAIAEMTQRGYVIPKLDKYQHMIDIQKLVNIKPRGLALTNDILIPRENDYRDDKTCESSVETDKIIHLEIGFGQGENLLTNSMMRPDHFYIGAEIHQPGVGVALNRMKQALQKGTYWDGQNWLGKPVDISSQQLSNESKQVDDNLLSYDNLRIYPRDGVKILRFLPPSSVDNIYLTFPDPWPKRSQSPYRVIQEDTLELIANVLKPGGHFYLATDSVIFDEWTRNVFSIVSKQSMEKEGLQTWIEVDICPSRENWLPVLSKYELKGIEEGRETICRCWKYIGKDKKLQTS